jgi:excisionase family DNA binding protein
MMTTEALAEAEPAVYQVMDVARLLGISKNHAYLMLNSGTIPAIRLGRRLVIPRAAFDAWLASAGAGVGARIRG